METAVRMMLDRDLISRGIHDPLVLDAMSKVPRERFVLPEYQQNAYDDRPLPIGHQQTISQPYIVALMVQLAAVKPESSVLDIGTGCGYMAAILAQIAELVCTLERIPELVDTARQHFRDLDINNIDSRVGDAYQGWPGSQFFDSILVSCAGDRPPTPLVNQLRPGGTIVMPVSTLPSYQILTSFHKDQVGHISETQHTPVRFVPMI